MRLHCITLLGLLCLGGVAWAQDGDKGGTPEAVTEETVSEDSASDESGTADVTAADEAVDEDDTPESTNLTDLLRPTANSADVAESLLDASRFIDGLIPPLDPAVERARVASTSGRNDPFQVMSIRPPVARDPDPIPPLPPAIPQVRDNPPINSGSTTPVTSNPPVSVPVPPRPPEPTPDPAEFAKSVQVDGVIQIGNDTFALLSSTTTVSEVVSVGGRYESAFVSGISLADGQVLLEEGGQTVSIVIPE